MPDLSNPETFLVDLQPVGRRVQVIKGSTLLEAAQAAGVELVAVCGGNASCGTCRVRLVDGRLNTPNLVEEAELSQDEISSGFRLACQAEPLSNVRIDIPPESLTTAQRLQIEGEGSVVALDPLIQAVDVSIPPPDLYDLRSDVSRLKATLGRKRQASMSIPHAVLSLLPDQLRNQAWSARLAVRRPVGKNAKILAAVLPFGSDLLGMAVDIGTTKLAVYLVDLLSGETLAKQGAMNPQIGFGEDVISRISYANEHENGRETLQRRLVDSLNQLVSGLCSGVGKSPQQIVEAVVVGNTAMHHLFAGLPVQQLGHAPYIPVIGESLEIPARELGLELAPGAIVYLPPNIAGYVGADHVSMLLAMDVLHAAQPTIALDIGTNTEITLSIPDGAGSASAGARNRLLSCSCASGPAFEGAHIQAGMRAAPGAVERIQISDGQLHIHTIGGLPPVGICGSGILDAVAQMLSAGILDHRGVLRLDNPFVRQDHGRREFLLAGAERTGNGRDLVVSREDVQEIQLAKGAIRAGVEVLLADAGLAGSDIQQFIVAGAFGTYLDLESAVRVGMFPDLPRDRFRQVGNAAGMGARQMLLSKAQRDLATHRANCVEYIELTTHASFTPEFVKALILEV